KGRLQVLVLRNAMHIGWLLQGRIESEEIIRRAIAISNYQLRIRRRYKPIMGDSPWAQMESLITQKVNQQKSIERAKLYRIVHAERFGLQIFTKAIEMLAQEGVIAIE